MANASRKGEQPDSVTSSLRSTRRIQVPNTMRIGSITRATAKVTPKGIGKRETESQPRSEITASADSIIFRTTLIYPNRFATKHVRGDFPGMSLPITDTFLPTLCPRSTTHVGKLCSPRKRLDPRSLESRWSCDGSYGIDCHVVQMVREKGKLVPENTRHVACNNYDIPYRSLIPADIKNLLVPVCCSASHVAYCSLRMEPVFMMLGHAAGDAAHLAILKRPRFKLSVRLNCVSYSHANTRSSMRATNLRSGSLGLLKIQPAMRKWCSS